MSIARPYQSEAVQRAIVHTRRRRAATLVLPTGAGKTTIAAFYIREVLQENPQASFVFLQGSEELLHQNMATVSAITGASCSVVMADLNDWTGQVVFASVQTLTRSSRLVDMMSITNLVVDECHHSAAPSWLRVIDHAQKRNPKIRILGLSATPDRGDGKPLPKQLGEIVYRVYMQELIDSGFLVPPRAFSVQMGDAVERIGGLRGSETGSGDQTEVAKILDTPIYNQAIVRQWRARAAGRPTIAFCSTIEHARNVAAAFIADGIEARAIDYSDKEGRRKALEEFRDGKVKILTNCLLLTEGFDYQPTSCVLILRAMLHVSTFMQALGRSLRTVDADKHPGVLKVDSVCLDFSGAAARHRELDTKTNLHVDVVDLHDLEHEERPSDAMPAPANDLEPDDDTFVPTLEEIDFSSSQFRWTDIHRDGRTMLVSGLSGFAAFCPAGEHWVAFGRAKDGLLHILQMGNRLNAYAAASDFIRRIEKDDRAVGNRLWLNDPITTGQKGKLRALGYRTDDLVVMNKYEASCHITYMEERQSVRREVHSYMEIARLRSAA